MNEPAAKRRRVRKGTRSCWECRRRKVKCQFNNPTESVCINCTEREATCLSQKFAVAHSPSPSSSSDVPGRTRPPGLLVLADDDAPSRATLCPTGDLLDFSAATHAHSIAAAANGTVINDHLLSPELSASSASPDTTSPGAIVNHPYIVAHQKSARQRHLQISRQLHALLPSPHLRGVLAHESPGASWVLTFAHNRHDQIAGKVEPTWSLASTSWPLPETHPVLIARRLLQYSICMQCLPPNFDVARFKLPGGCQPCELLGKWAGAVWSLVTNDEELISCAEGIETLALLSIFQLDAGHLRRAWMTNRRTLSFCQLMGIERLPTRQLFRSCAGAKDPLTMPSIPVLWRRINCTDRYLSLILGLPAGSHRDTFANAEPSPSDNPLDLLEQEHAVICRKIADRNYLTPGSAEAHSLTFSINDELQRASGNMDNNWWATPDFSTGTAREVTSMSSFGPVSRFLAARSATKLQVQHYTLLILLHLPYLLRKKEGPRDLASQEACMCASRAILERFLAFRKLNIMNISGRPIDYSALIAGMTLPMTYLGADTEIRDVASDRDLLERTILVFREMASFKRDRLALESADTIHQLLPMLADGPPRTDQEPLELKIPFLGTVTINQGPARQDSSLQGTISSLTGTDTLVEELPFDPQLLLSLDSDPSGLQSSDSLFGSGSMEQPFLMGLSPDLNPGDWTFQGIDAVYWSTLSQSVNEFAE